MSSQYLLIGGLTINVLLYQKYLARWRHQFFDALFHSYKAWNSSFIALVVISWNGKKYIKVCTANKHTPTHIPPSSSFKSQVTIEKIKMFDFQQSCTLHCDGRRENIVYAWAEKGGRLTNVHTPYYILLSDHVDVGGFEVRPLLCPSIFLFGTFKRK